MSYIYYLFEILLTVGLYLLTALSVVLLFAFLIALFHPLKFRLRLNSSFDGHRLDFWFIYFFRLLKVGVLATEKKQNVCLKFAFWKKLHNLNPSPPKTDTDSESESESALSSKPISQSVSPQEPEPESPSKHTTEPKSDIEAESTLLQKTESADQPKQKIEPQTTSKVESKTLSESEPVSEEDLKKTEADHKAQVTSDKKHPHSHEDTKLKTDDNPENIQAQTYDQSTFQDDQSIFHEEKDSKEGSEQKPAKNIIIKFKKVINKLKSNLSLLLKYSKLFKQKWQLLWPLFSKFFSRAASGFVFRKTAIMLRYALHEHHLTGMLQAPLSVFSGFADNFGINFTPIPEFSEPSYKLKGQVILIIKPWRLAYGLVLLFFSKTFIKEIWNLIKFAYKKRKEQ